MYVWCFNKVFIQWRQTVPVDQDLQLIPLLHIEEAIQGHTPLPRVPLVEELVLLHPNPLHQGELVGKEVVEMVMIAKEGVMTVIVAVMKEIHVVDSVLVHLCQIVAGIWVLERILESQSALECLD